MELTKHSFEIPIYVSHFEKHAEVKAELMELLESLDAPAVNTPGSPILRSSWGLREMNKKWRPTFFKMLRTHLMELFNDLKTPSWEVYEAWFQTYQSGNTHRAHTHGACTWASVYYLDLPNPTYGTVFYHPSKHWVELRSHLQSDSPPILRPEVKEGDVVSFPGYLEHEAPLMSTDDMKTIIAFNVITKHQKGSR